MTEKRKVKKKIIVKIVVHYRHGIQLPERRPTGTLTPRANKTKIHIQKCKASQVGEALLIQIISKLKSLTKLPDLFGPIRRPGYSNVPPEILHDIFIANHKPYNSILTILITNLTIVMIMTILANPVSFLPIKIFIWLILVTILVINLTFLGYILTILV